MIDPDQAIQASLNGHVLPGYGPFFTAVTWLGEAYLWLAVLAVCILVGRWRKIAALLAIVILFGMVINEDVKDIVRRERPGGIEAWDYFSFDSYSFPSGHTQTAFAIATVLSAFLARRYSIVTYLLACAVGVSRMYLGYHYFTDAVGGALIGIAIGELAIYGAYCYGLVERGGIVQMIVGALNVKAKGAGLDNDAVKRGIALLSIGFLLAMALMLIGQPALSLAIVPLAYLLTLYRTGFRRKSRVS